LEKIIRRFCPILEIFPQKAANLSSGKTEKLWGWWKTWKKLLERKTSNTFENVSREIMLFVFSLVILRIKKIFKYWIDVSTEGRQTWIFRIVHVKTNVLRYRSAHLTIIYSSAIIHQQMRNVSCVSSENVMYIYIHISLSMEHIILQKVSALLFVHHLFHFIAFSFNIYVSAHNFQFATRLSKNTRIVRAEYSWIKVNIFLLNRIQIKLMLVHLCQNNQQKRKLFNWD